MCHGRGGCLKRTEDVSLIDLQWVLTWEESRGGARVDPRYFKRVLNLTVELGSVTHSSFVSGHVTISPPALKSTAASYEIKII